MTDVVFRSFSDIRTLLAALPEADGAALDAAHRREPQLTKPPGSLGRLEEISHHLAAWQGRHPPRLDCVRAQVFAGNHGVAALGVSAYPPAVTEQMVLNFRHGGAAINQLCGAFGIELAVDALDLDRPTADFTQGPAMSEDECVSAMTIGARTATAGTDLLVLGEMGIGNTTPAAALCHALYGGQAADWTALGGRELAAIAGAVLAARLRRIPVMLDGYVCTAAAGILDSARPGALDHCLVGHVSVEPGHRRLLAQLGKRPLLDFDMRLGEASGAALAVALARGAIACHNGMATFADAGVSGKVE